MIEASLPSVGHGINLPPRVNRDHLRSTLKDLVGDTGFKSFKVKKWQKALKTKRGGFTQEGSCTMPFIVEFEKKGRAELGRIRTESTYITAKRSQQSEFGSRWCNSSDPLAVFDVEVPRPENEFSLRPVTR
jgi:hypothetical protein